MTIYALSSGPGISGIAVIRISGGHTSVVVKQLIKKKTTQWKGGYTSKILWHTI